MSGFTAEQLRAQIPRLRRYARALTGSRDAADDLTQDTLERAWFKRALWRPDPTLGAASLRAWLFAVMHRVFLNETRRRRPTEDIDENSFDESADVDTPEGAIALRDLHRALAQLAAEHRSVLLLVGLEGLSYEETAQVLSIPIGTVMSRLSRARERLRQLLEGRVPAAVPLRRVK